MSQKPERFKILQDNQKLLKRLRICNSKLKMEDQSKEKILEKTTISETKMTREKAKKELLSILYALKIQAQVPKEMEKMSPMKQNYENNRYDTWAGIERGWAELERTKAEIERRNAEIARGLEREKSLEEEKKKKTRCLFSFVIFLIEIIIMDWKILLGNYMNCT